MGARITKAEMMRAAEVAAATGQAVTIKTQDREITVAAPVASAPAAKPDNEVDKFFAG